VRTGGPPTCEPEGHLPHPRPSTTWNRHLRWQQWRSHRWWRSGVVVAEARSPRLWSPVAVAVLLSRMPATATLPSPLAVAVLLSPSSPAVAVLLSPGANYESAAQEPEATGCVNPLPS